MAELLLTGDVDVRITETGLMAIVRVPRHSGDEQRDLIHLTPESAEKVILLMIDLYGPSREKMIEAGRDYHRKTAEADKARVIAARVRKSQGKGGGKTRSQSTDSAEGPH